LIFDLIVPAVGEASLKTTSFQWYQMHQKTRMMAIHRSRRRLVGYVLVVYHYMNFESGRGIH
jgi:hypothetical protein